MLFISVYAIRQNAQKIPGKTRDGHNRTINHGVKMSEEIKKEVEQVNQSIVPSSTEIVNIEKTVEQARRYFNVLGQIRKLAIKLTNNLDWTNEGGNPYMQKSGCDKIAGAFGVRISDALIEKEICKDDKGEYVMYTCSARGTWNNHEESEIGTCSTRDDFFGKRDGGYKPLSEVDLTDIKKKAFTNMANRMIKKLLGLSFSWDEIKELSEGKISADSVQKVSYGAGSKGGNTDSPETKKKRDEIRVMLLKLCDGEAQHAQHMLEEMTAFTGNNGPVKGKSNVLYLTEKQIPFVHANLTKKIEELDKQIAKNNPEGYGT